MRDADVGLQAGQNKGATQTGHGGMGNTRWGRERGPLTNHALVLNTTLPPQAHVIRGGTGGGSLVRTTSMCKMCKMGDIGYYAHIKAYYCPLVLPQEGRGRRGQLASGLPQSDGRSVACCCWSVVHVWTPEPTTDDRRWDGPACPFLPPFNACAYTVHMGIGQSYQSATLPLPPSLD